MAGPTGSSAELQIKMATARLFTLAYPRAGKTNLVPMHPRGCTAGSTPRGPGSPFFLRAFLSPSQDALPETPFSESGSSDGKSTSVFPYQLEAK